MVSFLDEACLDVQVAGGKGANLARLSRLQTEAEFRVPRGLVCTVHAFQEHVRANARLSEFLDQLDSGAEPAEEVETRWAPAF